MPKKYMICSKEEKPAIVKRNLAGESAMSLSRKIGSSYFQIKHWTKIYLTEGETDLEPKKKPINLLSRYEQRKN